MLRQSIIHVEQDDIDFDEEELEGERPGDARPRTAQDESQDVEMSAMDTEPTSEEPYHESSSGSPFPSARTSSMAPAAAQQSSETSAPKRRMVITHDKYMTMQSMVVLHLTEIEREKGLGLDRDELIDWYLETMEETIQDLDELEYEKELFTKVLKKLVKVSCRSRFLVCGSPNTRRTTT